MKHSIEGVDSIIDLSPSELRATASIIDEKEKPNLLKSIKELNNLKLKELDELKKEMESIRAIDNILLTKVWRTLSKDNKAELAEFFKELSDEINREEVDA